MSWNTKNTGGYALGSSEADANAVMIYNALHALGYEYNPICAILGNIGYESGYNPWRWQSDYVVSTTETTYINTQSGHAYGLFQFDPAGGYINNWNAQQYNGYGPNFADQPGSVKDGAAQIKWMNNDSGGYIPTASYPLTFAQFKVSTDPVSYLTYAWEYNYERGTWDAQRLTHAQYWETNLINLIPTGIPAWLLFKFRERRRS